MNVGFNNRNNFVDISRKRIRGQFSWHSLFILLIIISALVLRLWGNNFGLPYEYHIDEQQYVRQGASIGEKGLEPTWWNNPPLLKYLFFAEYGGLYIVGRVLGWYASIGDFASQNTSDPTTLYLLGRSTSAVMGTLTVLVVYYIGKEGYRKSVGLIAGLLLAVCFVHVRDSHYATNDIAATLFMTIVLLAAIKISQSNQKKWYVLAGCALGLGFATKYTAMLATITVLTGHLLSPEVNLKKPVQLKINLLLLFGIVAVISAIFVSPFFILAARNVTSDIVTETWFPGNEVPIESSFTVMVDTLIFYLKSLTWGLGWLLLFFSIAGIAKALKNPTDSDLILIIYIAVLITSLVIMRQQLVRFALPLIPPLLVLAASFIVFVSSRIAPEDKKRSVYVLLSAIVILVVMQPLASVIRHNYLLTQTDTRTLAKQWIEENITGGAKIAVDWPTHGPPLSTSKKKITNSDVVYRVTAVGGPGLWEHQYEWYVENDYDYLITSSYIIGIPAEGEDLQEIKTEFYESLDHRLELIAEFSPYQGKSEPPYYFDEMFGPARNVWQLERPGPTIKVYQLSETKA